MTKLTILHTNDIHGRVPRLTRIASLVREIRQNVENEGGYCLYVDAGDSEDTTMLESSLTKGSAMEALLRAAGCDHVALGNAIPIRYGPQAIADLARHFGRLLLCANMNDEHGNLVQGLEPFAIETCGSLKIALIGLTAPTNAYESFFKLKMDKPAEVLPTLIAKAKSEGAKTIILLSHLGSKVDQEVAKDVKGIDVIVGAHDHKELYLPVVVDDTIIVQAGDFGRLLGKLDLTIDPDTGKVMKYEGELIPITEDIPFDPLTQKALEREQKRIQQIMNREIGILNSALELSDDHECAAGNVLADALLDRVKGAQLSLVLAGHWESGLDAGPLTQGVLFASNRSTANPGKAELTGSQILQFLREALKPENCSRQLQALRGRAIGRPHVAGASVSYSANLEDIRMEINGKPLDVEGRYVVASTDMEFSDYIGYLVLSDKEVEYEVPTIMPEVLQDYVVKCFPLEKPDTNRIRLQEQ